MDQRFCEEKELIEGQNDSWGSFREDDSGWVEPVKMYDLPDYERKEKKR